MNATDIAAALAGRAEQVCRRYLPNGRKQGRYWTCGDARGARGRSLFVRLAPPGAPGKWTDAATGEHGDLLDLIGLAIGAAALNPALEEARAFLAMPAVPAAGEAGAYDRSGAARRLWRACRAVDGTHAEAYLRARAIDRCRFPALRFHPALNYRDRDGFRRLPALVAAVTGDGGAVCGIHRTWLDPSAPAKAAVLSPRKALGHIHGRAVRFGGLDRGTLLVGEGIETVLSLVAAVPAIPAAAALSAGSLGAFAPPSGLARLVIARDNDAEGARAAERLRRRCRELGIAAAVAVPRRGDFNDDLIAFGAQALAAGIAPLFRTPDRGRARRTGAERPVGARRSLRGMEREPAPGAPRKRSGFANRGRDRAMDHVTFERIGPGESRIRLDGECVGSVYRLPDNFNPGAHIYSVHLHEDRRGPVYIHDRARIREVAEGLVDTHPFL